MLRPFLLTLLLLPHLLLASPEVKIEAKPRVTTEASNIKVSVEPNEMNRKLVIEWYLYPGFENRKWYDLGGIDAPKVFRYQIKFNESGEWQVKARVFRSDDSQKVDWTTVIVKRAGDMN